MDRPNIVLIYTDQQRFDTLGANGNKLAITPNLDKLASEGANFQNYFVNNPVCAPSRMCLLSGKYPSELHILDNGMCFPDDEVTIAHRLAQYGYHTAQIGKLHFLPHVNRKHQNYLPKQYGFDKFIISDEPGCYDDSYIKWVEAHDKNEVSKCRIGLPSLGKVYNQPVYSTQKRSPQYPYVFEGDDELTHSKYVSEEVCSFIKSQKKNQDEPFFVIAGFYAPHAPINPPKKYIDMYNLDDFSLPIMDPREAEEMDRYFNTHVFDDKEEFTEERLREIRRSYYALTTHVDECIGEILDELEDIKDNTLVIFTSDHGEYLGDHTRVHKGMPGHDCICNVPLIMRYPKMIKEGVRPSNLCEAVDIVPTILDYAIIPHDTHLKGISLKDTIETNSKVKDCIIIEYLRAVSGLKETAIRDDHYKYYVNSDGFELLYDLDNDKDEMHNVVNEDKYREVLSLMRKKMIVKMQEASYVNRDIIAPY